MSVLGIYSILMKSTLYIARNDGMRNFLIILSLLSSGYLLAIPYLTCHDLQQAFQNSDTQTIEELVDFQSVRTSVTKQIAPSQKQDDGLLTMIGKKIATGAVELVVDAVVTPDGLAKIMAGNTKSVSQQSGSEISDDQLNYHMYYADINRFHIDVLSKDDDRVVATFVLTRSGINWIVTEILIAGL